MSRLIAFSRCCPSKTQLLKTASSVSQATFFSSNTTSSSGSSSSSSSSDDEKKKSRKKPNSEALNKLNDLLKQMTEEQVANPRSRLELAKPKDKRKKKLQTEKDKALEEAEVAENKTNEEKIVAAVQDVAKTLGGDAKKTESELLIKLLNPVENNGVPSVGSLSDIIKGMKIDRESKPEGHSRAQQVQKILKNVNTQQDSLATARSSRQPRRRPQIQTREKEMHVEKIDLFGSEPLSIFTDLPPDATEGVENKIWNKFYERELKLAVTHPPANYFQQMILWTEQGKVWKFPIDNEQGLEKEQNVYFAEHVFLEKHLEPWCPPKGPLRHFMELVCVGLSKNPYLTVEAKKEHIDWFRNYFEEKKKLLQEVGALQADQLEPKKIES